MNNLVPDGWENKKLDIVSRVIDSAHQTPVFSKSGIPMVRVGDINGGKVSLTNTRFVTDDIYKIFAKNHEPQFDDVLMTRVGSYGRSSIVKTKKQFCLGQNTVVINPREINSDFLFQFLQTENIYNQIEDTVSGSSQKSLSLAAIKNLKILNPPLPEQQKIAKILTAVDEVIEKTQAQIDKLKDLKIGMMQELLTNGIGNNGKPHTKFKDSPVGRIPAEWEVKKLSAVSKVVDSLHQTPTFSRKGLSMIRVSDIREGKVNISKAMKVSDDVFSLFTKNHLPTKGDILMSRVGSYGVCCFINDDTQVCIGQNTVVITSTSIEYLFLFYLLSSYVVQKQIEFEVAGSGYKSLSLASIRNLTIILPDKEEQTKIANIIQSLDNKREFMNNKLLLIKNTKKALMQDLLTGKVRVKVEPTL